MRKWRVGKGKEQREERKLEFSRQHLNLLEYLLSFQIQTLWDRPADMHSHKFSGITDAPGLQPQREACYSLPLSRQGCVCLAYLSSQTSTEGKDQWVHFVFFYLEIMFGLAKSQPSIRVRFPLVLSGSRLSGMFS